MPTLTRPPAVPAAVMTHRLGTGRGGDERVGAPVPPPEVLLPSGGPDRHGNGDPLAWTDAAFQRRVQAIHRQLLPIGSRAALASSYDREAGRPRGDDAGGSTRRERHGPAALQVAYARRWLELPDTADLG